MKNRGIIIGVLSVFVTAFLKDAFRVSFVDFKPQLIFTLLGVLFIAGLVGWATEKMLDLMFGSEQKENVEVSA